MSTLCAFYSSLVTKIKQRLKEIVLETAKCRPVIIYLEQKSCEANGFVVQKRSTETSIPSFNIINTELREIMSTKLVTFCRSSYLQRRYRVFQQDGGEGAVGEALLIKLQHHQIKFHSYLLKKKV